MRAVAPDVTMIGTGWVASAGALIYAAAKKENRYALPNTRFLLHQPFGGILIDGGVRPRLAHVPLAHRLLEAGHASWIRSALGCVA